VEVGDLPGRKRQPDQAVIDLFRDYRGGQARREGCPQGAIEQALRVTALGLEEGHRVEAEELALPLGPLSRLAQDEEPGVRRGEAGGRGGLEQIEMAINYRSHFTYRIDAWDADGQNVIEHLAGVEDLQV
jgi:hypothetical protein